MPMDDRQRDRALERAYRATTYAAEVRGRRVAIRVGEESPDAAEALDLRAGETWAYLTAWNPDSRERSREENDAAQERLRQALRGRGIRFFEAMSEPDDGRPGEGSLLAVVSVAEAIELGRAFGQKAIVVGGPGQRARLEWM